VRTVAAVSAWIARTGRGRNYMIGVGRVEEASSAQGVGVT
jgi:hypothetical protein